jgi:hypothetical protein
MLCIIPRHRVNGSEMVEVQPGAKPPGYKVVGAGRVAADADRADFLATLGVEPEAAAKHVDPADALTDQRVVWAPE